MRTSLSVLIGLTLFSTVAIAAAPGAGTASAAAAAAGAPDATKEVATALAHAQMSVAGKNVDEVHMHLHHVINCLEGENGADFDASTENPCKGMGQGALNDVENTRVHSKLDAALKNARTGLKKKTVKGAKADARDVVKDLQAAQKKEK